MSVLVALSVEPFGFRIFPWSEVTVYILDFWIFLTQAKKEWLNAPMVYRHDTSLPLHIHGCSSLRRGFESPWAQTFWPAARRDVFCFLQLTGRERGGNRYEDLDRLHLPFCSTSSANRDRLSTLCFSTSSELHRPSLCSHTSLVGRPLLAVIQLIRLWS